jgi:flagellar biogenesis protein FliO
MPAAGSQAPVGVLPVVQMLVALGVVLAMLKWLMPLVLKKYGNRVTSNGGSGIRIQETAAFGPANLAVVVVRGKTLFLGATSAGISCLADLTTTEALPPTFQELLENSDPNDKPMDDLSDLASQLERLRRIGG